MAIQTWKWKFGKLASKRHARLQRLIQIRHFHGELPKGVSFNRARATVNSSVFREPPQ